MSKLNSRANDVFSVMGEDITDIYRCGVPTGIEQHRIKLYGYFFSEEEALSEIERLKRSNSGIKFYPCKSQTICDNSSSEDKKYILFGSYDAEDRFSSKIKYFREWIWGVYNSLEEATRELNKRISIETHATYTIKEIKRWS